MNKTFKASAPKKPFIRCPHPTYTHVDSQMVSRRTDNIPVNIKRCIWFRPVKNDGLFSIQFMFGDGTPNRAYWYFDTEEARDDTMESLLQAHCA